MGYYDNKRRREGEVFELRAMSGLFKDKDGKLVKGVKQPEELFSEKWMEKVEDEEREEMAPKKARKAKVEPEIAQDDEVI